jgi:hypothetical protein
MSITQTAVGYLTKILQALTNEVNDIGNQTIVATGTAQALTPTSGAVKAIVQVESAVTTATIRYWGDGSIPTSTVGMYQSNGAVIELTTAENIRNFRFIQGAAGAIQLNVTYSK